MEPLAKKTVNGDLHSSYLSGGLGHCPRQVHLRARYSTSSAKQYRAMETCSLKPQNPVLKLGFAKYLLCFLSFLLVHVNSTLAHVTLASLMSATCFLLPLHFIFSFRTFILNVLSIILVPAKHMGF